MSRIESLFPSRFLSAGDLLALPNKEVTVTIERVYQDVFETQGGEKQTKVFLKFAEFSKSMLLNRTNSKTIARNYGPETDDWAGAVITLYPAEVEFKGEQVMALRIRPSVPFAAKLQRGLAAVEKQA